MNSRYNSLFRITFFLVRAFVFGFLNLVLSALAQVGCKGFDEVLNNLKQEQRDCEQFHGRYMTVGAWKVFCTTLAFVLISRYNVELRFIIYFEFRIKFYDS